MRYGMIAGGVALAMLLGAPAMAVGAPAAKAPPKAAAKAGPAPAKPAVKPPARKPAAPGAASALPYLPPDEALHAARQLNDAGQTAAAYARLKTLIASPDFRTLTPSQQHAARYLMGGIAMNTQKYDEAHEAFRAATDNPGATGMDWFARGATASAVSDDADVVYALTRLAADFPAAIILASDDTVTGALAAADRTPDPATRRYALMEALFDAHWKPKDPLTDVSDAWRRHALALMARGRGERAAAVALTRVGDPYSLVALRADRRFDGVTQAYPNAFNVTAAAERDLAVAKKAMAAQPLKLAPVNAEARALLRLGRPAEALTLLDAVVAKALPNAGESPYQDQGEVLWTLDLRAQALMGQGRADEAVAAMAHAATLLERGGPNVTQTTALAWMNLRLGKPKEALAALSGLNGGLLTPAQVVVAESAQACALQGMGNADGAKGVLADMKTRLKDGALPYFNALICVGDEAGAAALVLQQLGDPVGRGSMLLALQGFKPLGPATAFDKLLDQRRTRLLARPEIEFALDSTGRIEAQPLTAPFD